MVWTTEKTRHCKGTSTCQAERTQKHQNVRSIGQRERSGYVLHFLSIFQTNPVAVLLVYFIFYAEAGEHSDVVIVSIFSFLPLISPLFSAPSFEDGPKA